MRIGAIAAIVLTLLLAPPAGVARAQDGDGEAPLPPTWHGWFAGGGALPIGGPAPGTWAGGGLSGRRWGVRVEGFLFDPGSDARLGLAAAGLSYELGRTKRHLVVTAHFGGGVRFPEVAPLLTTGLHTQLGLMKDGPLVLGSDVALHVDMGQLPLDVYLVATLSIGLAW